MSFSKVFTCPLGGWKYRRNSSVAKRAMPANSSNAIDTLPPSIADPLNNIRNEIKVAAMASPKNKKIGKAISRKRKTSAIIAQAHQVKYIASCITSSLATF